LYSWRRLSTPDNARGNYGAFFEMSENSVRTIIDCGNQYRKEYLDPLKGDTLLTDWWKALDFL